MEGIRGTRYVLGDELPQLRRAIDDDAAGRPQEDASAVFLAPLDPLAWDRDLLRSLFEFDYVWEVYAAQAKCACRWGYYVRPPSLRVGTRMVGRIEPRIDRGSGSIRILGIWWQDGFVPRREAAFVAAMKEALAAYARFGGVSRIDWGQHGLEQRLFGRASAHIGRYETEDLTRT